MLYYIKKWLDKICCKHEWVKIKEKDYRLEYRSGKIEDYTKIILSCKNYGKIKEMIV